MEEYLAKLKEYLNMETELPFAEFAAFFEEFTAFLGANYEQFDQTTSLNARFVASILEANSQERAKRKTPETKRFKKMAQKSRIWLDAMNYRLLKSGMSQAQIDKANAEISDAM
ncbi:MAG: hypothetical protein M0Z55_12160 [Peptococcaceae bacterium]|nr:hypothetical protein [Peptococcaceae bacterium]